MEKSVPTKLGKDSIVDATCEFQVATNVKLSQVMVGILYTGLSGEKAVSQTSVSQIPAQLLSLDPKLKFHPLVSVEWNGYLINFSDHSFQVACKLPYPRWVEFKRTILEVCQVIFASNLIQEVTRYSLKYSDFIVAKDGHEPPLNYVDLSLHLGGKNYSQNTYQLNMEIADGNFLHLLNIANPARQIDGDDSVVGVLVSTDSIVNCSRRESTEFLSGKTEAVGTALEELHVANKAVFFNALSEDGLNTLEPVYE